MQELTKPQEQILEIIWHLKDCIISDIVEELPEPKPAYTTIATVVKVLVKKEFVKKSSIGKTHFYSALITREEYRQHFFSGSFRKFFNNSINQVVSFFSNEEKLSLSELEDLKKYVETEIEKKTKK